MRRLYLPFVLLLAFALSLAVACGGDDPTPTAEPTQPAGADPTETPADPGSTPSTGDPTSTPPAQAATATPVAQQGDAPDPQSPEGTLEVVMDLVTACGLPRENCGVIDQHVHETLFIPEGGLGTEIVTGWLAEEWEVADDFSSATIQLKQGVQFHGGFGEMTAEDVAWSFSDVLSAESTHTATSRLRPVFDDMEVLDTYTVRIPFKTPVYEWNSQFNNQFVGANRFPVVSKSAYDQNGPQWMLENMIGTGAYEVVQHRENEILGIQAVDDHYYKTGQMEFINIREVGEASTRRAMLETGQADAGIVPLREMQDLLEIGFGQSDAGKSSMKAIWYAGQYWEEYDYNCLNGRESINCDDIQPGESREVALDRPGYDPSLPWIGEYGNDESMEQARLVRQAMSMAVDRDLINEFLLDGLGRELHSGAFPMTDPHWDSKWEIPHDPNESERLLDEAGYPAGADGTRFDVELYIGPHAGGAAGTSGEMADAIGGMWDDIGIRTAVIKTAYEVYRPAAVNRELNQPWLNACGGNDARESTPWDWPRGQVMTSLSRGGFGCAMEIPEIAELYDQAISEPDPARRIEINKEVQDFYHHWMLNSGVVVVPDPVVWNTKKVAEWPMRASASAVFISPDLIVPAQ
ncbi:MAG: ABC transporter substrate-binding protein [Dehalococcoidia bacterium]